MTNDHYDKLRKMTPKELNKFLQAVTVAIFFLLATLPQDTKRTLLKNIAMKGKGSNG
jgi:hypothetical protein